MCFNAIQENNILTKISEFTVNGYPTNFQKEDIFIACQFRVKFAKSCLELTRKGVLAIRRIFSLVDMITKP